MWADVIRTVGSESMADVAAGAGPGRSFWVSSSTRLLRSPPVK
jgi:hypothetical protein